MEINCCDTFKICREKETDAEGFDSAIHWWEGHYNIGGGYKINFCPFCGKAITKENK